jgi:hypothetical protein
MGLNISSDTAGFAISRYYREGNELELVYGERWRRAITYISRGTAARQPAA